MSDCGGYAGYGGGYADGFGAYGGMYPQAGCMKFRSREMPKKRGEVAQRAQVNLRFRELVGEWSDRQGVFGVRFASRHHSVIP